VDAEAPRQRPGGHSGKCGKFSPSASQGTSCEVQMCTAGLTFGSSSSVATRSTTCGWSARSATIWLPHAAQNRRIRAGRGFEGRKLFPARGQMKMVPHDARGGRVRRGMRLAAGRAMAMTDRRVEAADLITHRSAQTASFQSHGSSCLTVPRRPDGLRGSVNARLRCTPHQEVHRFTVFSAARWPSRSATAADAR
jgi:hypothetical protein